VIVTRPAEESLLVNPLRSATAPLGTVDDAPMRFHRSIPGYAPSPLLEAPTAAAALGAERLLVKRETERFGLPAFKILGASWATARALTELLAQRGLPAPGLDEGIAALVEAVIPLRPMTLCCATDGNHGRAVARMAKWLGFSSRIYVPEDMAPARIAAIESEGAVVVRLPGTYDDAIARSAEDAADDCLVISDTSWPGYAAIPQWVIEGYGTMFAEADAQLAGAAVDVVAIQLGVGALGAATVPFARRHHALLIGVEPLAAACNYVSLEAGEIVNLPGPHDSIMAGLNCGLASEIAWPVVSGHLDLSLAIEDRRAEDAIRLLARDGIVAGETGAAGLAGLLAWVERFGGDLSGKSALIVTTEGPTDPEAYERIVGSSMNAAG
jgi:diaminopropionate ammonia-lyase